MNSSSQIKMGAGMRSVKSGPGPGPGPGPGGGWTFLTNHTHVLVCLSREPQVRLREVASAVGITERAVQKIVAELEAGGVITREREGRRNQYVVHREVALRHPIEAHRTVGQLLDAVVGL